MSDFDTEKCHLKELSKDLLGDVLSRLDGLSLAAAACTCTELQDLATETGLWEDLCHTTWPSTASPVIKGIVPFDRFYSESHPLILYDDSVTTSVESETESFSDSIAKNLVSLVDIFYKGVCVFSKVIDGVPEAGNGNGVEENQKWFADCPFELDVIKFDYSQETEVDDLAEDEQVLRDDDEEDVKDYSQELEQNVRLSWVILNKKSQKSVNISSWKPLNIQKSWISSKSYTFQFGSAIPVEPKISAQGVAECVITARCERSENGLKWEEIGMSIKDINGAHLGGKKSVTVLKRAILSTRSNNMKDVRKGYERFEKKKMEMKRSRDCKETIANGLCLSVEIVIFAALYHTFFW